MSTQAITVVPGDVVTITATQGGALPPSPVPTPVPTPAPVPTGGTQQLGLNLGAAWESVCGARQKLFNDLFLTSRYTEGNAAGPSKLLFLTTSGAAKGAKVSGLYTLKATTTGTVTCNAGPVVKLSADTWQVNVQTDTDVILTFSAAATIQHIWRPGADETKTCSKEFLAFVKPFAYIRFMDLMNTNWADATDATARNTTLGPDGLMQWPERPPDSGSFNRTWGISFEAAIRICNEAKKPMWIDVTHVSSDQLFTALTAELAAKLDPALDVLMGFSNEPWNYAGGFYHSTLIKQMALAYVAAGTTPKLDNPADNEWYYAARYQVKRLHDLWAIANPVLGSRCKIIFESQLASGLFGNVLMWSKRTYGNNDWIHGLACAPYIWATDGTVDQIISTLTADYKTRQAPASKLAMMRALCDAHLKNNNLFFYEIGIDMGQSDVNLTNRCSAATSMLMADVVEGFLQTNVADKGVSGACWFYACGPRDKWGPAWALTDDASDLTQPMYVAAAEFAQSLRPVSGVTAEFFKNTDFTGLLEKKVTPVVDHAWQAWTNGPLHAGQNPTWTEGKDGSIRFSGRYTGTRPLRAVCEANDTATLSTSTDGLFSLAYIGRFGGNGSCFVQLQEQLADGTWQMVPTSSLRPA